MGRSLYKGGLPGASATVTLCQYSPMHTGLKWVSYAITADQDGTLVPQFSADGVTWTTLESRTVLAGFASGEFLVEQFIHWRLQWVNGAVAQTAFTAQMGEGMERDPAYRRVDVTTSTYSGPTPSFTHPVNLPPAVNGNGAGDFLIMEFVSIRAQGTTAPAPWTAQTSDQAGGGSGCRSRVFTLVCDGTEGATVDISVLSIARGGCARTWRIPAGLWSPATIDIGAATLLEPGSNPTPSASSPSWRASASSLFLVRYAARNDAGTEPVSGYPSGFVPYPTVGSGGTEKCFVTHGLLFPQAGAVTPTAWATSNLFSIAGGTIALKLA